MNALRFGPISLMFVLLFGGATCQSSNPSAEEGSTPSSGDAAALPEIDPKDMIMEAKGVDTSKLTEAQREVFFKLINTEASACGKAHSLAKSLRDDAECRDSITIAQVIADSIADGVSTKDLMMGIPELTDSLRVREISIEGRPVRGSERAPVTIVVFADFQCPHCAAEAPVLKKAVEQYRGQAKVVYRHFPLSMHPKARLASMATEAAFAQGDDKFWQMHDWVFANQQEVFDDEDEVEGKLRAHAEKIGLDMAAYDAFMQGEKGKAAIDKDRAAGEELKITGTPAVFVNGRYYNPVLFGGTINGWIDDALRR